MAQIGLEWSVDINEIVLKCKWKVETYASVGISLLSQSCLILIALDS